jgi:DNA helicase HerA-like ATPase
MNSLVQALGDRAVGAVEAVSANTITVLLDPEAPQATAINTGTPAGFPRINGYLLVPNEGGATVGVITSVEVERLPYLKRKGMQDFGLVDLPFPARLVALTPIGTLSTDPGGTSADLTFELHRGVDVFPSVGDPVLLPTDGQLRAIVEGERGRQGGRILLGVCPTARSAPVHVDPDKLFGRHVAILGNTGAGKSCTVAGLIRWSLDAARQTRIESGRTGEPNARFVVLDPNGEYARAFADLNVRLFQVEPGKDAQPLTVPAWLWNGDEWAAFTGAAPGVQRPILFDAIRRLRSGAGTPDAFDARVRSKVKRYATSLKLKVAAGEHLKPGKREGVAQFLENVASDFEELADDADGSNGQTKELLLTIAQKCRTTEQGCRGKPRDGGYWHNDIAETDLDSVASLLADVGTALGLSVDDTLRSEDTPSFFETRDLPGVVEALAGDMSGRDLAQFVDSLNLRIRGLFAPGPLASILQPTGSQSMTLDRWLTDHLGADQAANGAITVVDLSLVPSEVIHVVVAVLARLVFEALQRYRRLHTDVLPTVLVLEEAHTFIHYDLANDGAPPAGKACCRTFERIAREGRKFGLGLVLASQRPSEMSATVLSQCNTFLLHRLVNDRDQDLVRRLVPDALGDLLRELPSLPSRRAVLLGWGAPAPVMVEVRELPEHQRPQSPDPDFWQVWTGMRPRAVDWNHVAASWATATASGHSGKAVPPKKKRQGP